MPAVGSQMLSDVSSGIRRYTLADSSSSAGIIVSRPATTPRLAVHPETVSRDLRGVCTDVPERKLQNASSAGALDEDTTEVDFEVATIMYLEGGAAVAAPPGGRTAATLTSSRLTLASSSSSDDDHDHDDVEPAITMLEKVHATQGIWYLAELDRQTAEIYLRDFEIGVFIIRASSLPRTLALSLNIPSTTSSAITVTGGDITATLFDVDQQHKLTSQRVEHYLIEGTGQQQQLLSLEGSDVSFPSLIALVHYYTKNRNELPVPLRLPQLIDQVESRQDLLLLAQVANPADFWTSASRQQQQQQYVNIDISPSQSEASALSVSMLLDATDSSPAKLQLPHGSAFAKKVRDSIVRQSPDSTSGNISAEELGVSSLVNGQSRLSSKVSDYEDVWSLGDTKSPDYTMPSSTDGSTPDRSGSLEYRDSEPNRAKAVGLALRDLDALGDWIESELHDQRLSPRGSTHHVTGLLTPPASGPSTPDSTIENYHPDVTAVKEENRVIRRGKRRFAGAVAASRTNRFSAPNLSVNVEDLVGDEESGAEERELNNSTHAESIYSSVRDLTDRDVIAHQQEGGCLPVDDFACYTPPRKCMPSKDPNILEAFQSKVGALKRIGSKLLQRKSSLKTVNSQGSLPRMQTPPTSTSPQPPASKLESVLVFRTKKAGYDTCWPVDNNNWNVINRATPTISDISSGTSSSTGSGGAKSAKDINMNGKYLSIRSSKSPAGSLPKRSKTFSDFSDPSRDLEREITLERTVNFVAKNTRSDFNLSLQITEFLQHFAATPATDTVELFADLRLFLTTTQTYILSEHRTTLEDFISRDLIGSPELRHRSGNLNPYVVAAVQRLIVEPLCPKLTWNLQNKLGTAGDFARLEKGCAMFDAMELTADDVKPEIQTAVMEKLSALTSHFKSLAEAQNLLTKAKQLATIFSDVFGIDADPLEYSFADTISAFAMAIAKAKAYNVEVHLDFIWQLQAVDGSTGDGYLPVLLAASCAASALKSLASDNKLRLPEGIGRCLTPVSVSIKSRDECPVISHNFQVPLDQRLLGRHMASLLAAICDLNSDASDMTLRLSSGCLGFVLTSDVALKSTLDRWRCVYPDCRLELLVQTTKGAD